MLKKVYLKCQNGISFEEAKRNIFFELNGLFEFIESADPDFVLFGPYGNDIPQPGNYIRIGYFCENIRPDLSICEWAFGVPLESEINDPKYKRIQWHGLNPEKLVKYISDNDIDRILNTKKKFCNFIYSNPVLYREEFFRQLSRYKKVDAPGRSMNNMPSIDRLYPGDQWERKRKFLTEYKFTIAFENYLYPGYQTEKLYDAMQADSLPIYCGDNSIDSVFNKKSFLNVADLVKINGNGLVKVLEKLSEQNLREYNPSTYNSPAIKIFRKLKSVGRKAKMKIQLNNLDFKSLIEKIIEIDRDDSLYINYLREPWFVGNRIPEGTLLKQRWTEIFNERS